MSKNSALHQYIFPDFEQPVENEHYTGKVFFSFFLIFNGPIPLDLAVSFTMVKLVYVTRLNQDVKMIDEERSEQTGEI